VLPSGRARLTLAVIGSYRKTTRERVGFFWLTDEMAGGDSFHLLYFRFSLLLRNNGPACVVLPYFFNYFQFLFSRNHVRLAIRPLVPTAKR